MNQNIIALCALLLLIADCSLAQRVAISDIVITPDTSAILDVSSSTGGFLPPRMTSEQRLDIPFPAAGLLVFDTDDNHLYCFAGEWKQIPAAPISILEDADGDTRISVEESADEDMIRFSAGDTEYWRIHSARLEPVNSGESVFIGLSAGEHDDLHINLNMGIGDYALRENYHGIHNIALGHSTLRETNGGSSNIAVGVAALISNNIGNFNIAIGNDALFHNTASHNIAMGYRALYTNVTGTFNTAIGFQALYQNYTGDSNSAVGYEALKWNLTGLSNVALGKQALQQNNSGSYNTAIGTSTLYDNVSGNYNLALGNRALEHSTGSRNVAVGAVALNNNLTGEKNIAVGVDAGQQNTGSNNVFLGFESGLQNTGSNNVYLGYQAGKNIAGSDLLIIENSSSTSPLISGDFASDLLTINGSMGVGGGSIDCRMNVNADTAQNGFRVRINGGTKLLVHSNGGLRIGNNGTPLANGITVVGDAEKPGGGSWLASSDARLKTSVKDFTDGLDILTYIRPVRYHYTASSGLPAEKEYIGVIAQEMQEIAPYMVIPSEESEYLKVDISAATYLLINAVKELQELNTRLARENASLAERITALEKSSQEGNLTGQ